MNKSKLLITALTVALVIVIGLSILVLSLDAQPTNDPSTEKKYEDVCCGPCCSGGDYCNGVGKYTCCK